MASKTSGQAEHDGSASVAGSPAGGDERPGQLTWRGAIADVWRSAARHKVVTAVIAVCVAGSLAAIGVAGAVSSGSAASSASSSASLGSSGFSGTSGAAGSGAAPEAAAAFSLPALAGGSGQRVALSAYAGKPVVVNFFASWCGPCKTETPRLAAFYRAEHAKVAIVGLDENDTQANALAFTRADKVTYPVGFDPGMTAASAYDVAALPQTFFLNARHRVVDRIFGAVTQGELNKGIDLATKS